MRFCSSLLDVFILSAGQCIFPHSTPNESVCSLAGKQQRGHGRHEWNSKRTECFFVFSFLYLYLSVSSILSPFHCGSGSAWTSTGAWPAPLWSCWPRRIPYSGPSSWAQTSRSSVWWRWSSGTISISRSCQSKFISLPQPQTYIKTALPHIHIYIHIYSHNVPLHLKSGTDKHHSLSCCPLYLYLISFTPGMTMKNWRSSARCLPRTCWLRLETPESSK